MSFANEYEGLADKETETVTQPLADTLGDPEEDTVEESLTDEETVAIGVELSDTEGLPVYESMLLRDAVELLQWLEEAELDTVADPMADLEADVEVLPLTLLEPAGVCEAMEPLPEALAHAEKEALLAVPLCDGDGDAELWERVPDVEGLGVGEAPALWLELPDAAGDLDPDSETELLPETLGLSDDV